jgi:ribosome-associated protein
VSLPVADADLVIAPGRSLPHGLIVPGAELVERFSRSSGPGGQGVNTTDSRVELRWDVAGSRALTEPQRTRVLDALGRRLSDGVLVIVASEHRSQRQNRTAARGRLSTLIVQALEPPRRAPEGDPAVARGQAAAHRRQEAPRRDQSGPGPPTTRLISTCEPGPAMRAFAFATSLDGLHADDNRAEKTASLGRARRPRCQAAGARVVRVQIGTN